MALIKLTRGKHAIIDDEDLDRVRQHTWNCLKIGYAQCNRKTGEFAKTLLHRFILNYPKGNIDHVNGDKLDNRKINLRVATQSQNMANTGKRMTNKSGHKGVCWNKKYSKWEATLTKDYKHIFLGYFNEKLEASKAYNKGAVLHYGEFAQLNKI